MISAVSHSFALLLANICLRVLLEKLGADCTVVRDPLMQYVSTAANVEMCINDESSQYLHSSWLSLLTKVVQYSLFTGFVGGL